MKSSRLGLRVAVDIGGTFTDLVAHNERSGAVWEAKSPTTPRDYSEGVIDVLTHGSVDPDSVRQFVHGTTVVINAITERTGVTTALVTTVGFRDVLAIGRGNRPDMYNLQFRKPEPLVPRKLRFEVDERIRPDGSVASPLDVSQLEPIAQQCRDHEVGAIAICFLHAYANPAHEHAASRRLAELLPEVAITLSSDITREWREYERTSTAVLNAYVQPRTRAYLQHLECGLDDRGYGGNRFVMTSNGGTSTFRHAEDQPIHLVESGPAGGVIGSQVLGNLLDERNIITLDIGGTTAKCSVIVDGHLEISGDYRLEWTPLSPGYPARIPVIDIVEIGAGGGSIVWFDDAGALKIGPKSAGADPGPASYGIGGVQPTITDALVLAGFIEAGPIPGSNLVIDPDPARRAYEPIATRLGVTLDRVVEGVVDLFSAMTVDALKLVSVRRGHDPRDFALVAFGGGGPLHAARLGAELGVRRVIIPQMPATFSAWGMLNAPPRVDLVTTRVGRLDRVSQAEREKRFADLESRARDLLVSQGFDPAQFQNPIRSLDLRYQGQEHTVRTTLYPDSARQSDEDLENLFNREHRRMYTFSLEDTPIELVNYRVTVTAKLMSSGQVHRGGGGIRPSDNIARTVPVRRMTDGKPGMTIFRRDEIEMGFTACGPALIQESATSTVVPEGHQFEIDESGNIVISRLG
jgi:N-methylhydantoinase A